MSTTYPDLTYTTFPDSQQNFVEMIDINSSDGAILTTYQNAMLAGNFTAARQALAQLPNAENKIIDATKFNTLFDTCVALERFYLTDIQPYIEQKQEEWEALVHLFTDNFSYVGPYVQGNNYQQNNIVSVTNYLANETYLYIAIKNNSDSINNTESWRQLTLKGSTGISGEGLSFIGSWDGGQSYTVGDVVVYNNTLWQAIQDNNGQEPTENSEYWTNFGEFNVEYIVVSNTQPANQSVNDYWFGVI